MAYFTFRHQPFKGLYVAYRTISVPLFWIPLNALKFLVPYFRPKPTWTVTRSIGLYLLQASFQTWFSVGFDKFLLPKERQHLYENSGEVLVDELPEGLVQGEVAGIAKINQVVPEQISGYWFSKGGKLTGVGRHADPDEKILYYLHGGGYISGTISPRENYCKTPQGMLDHSFPSNSRAFGLEYRLTSGPPFESYAPFPAALIDALSGYHYLITTMGFSPENIVVAGDSAGGHLAFCLARYLCTEKLAELPPPGGLILLHPTADWALTDAHLPSSSVYTNYYTDYVEPFIKSGLTKRGLLGSLPEEAASRNPWISPGSLNIQTGGLFVDFPPTLIVASGAEQTVDGMRILYERLLKDNDAGRISWIEYTDTIHDFLCLTWHEPERSQALRHDIQAWVEQLYSH
ncbi:alpha/beta-hydrolase [Heliocybe sulcata]|uniref:Alpha/beta-hydrolase n=1 Tax=Heliocybe sulcata TaxID=5364 RepID=A0A5C3NEJ5_9AGAM|nr:alpha/beta-hydrolase [Heliocybe sulcata]